MTRLHFMLLAFCCITLLSLPTFAQVPYWPMDPQNQMHPLGNNCMEYQNYGGSPYFHGGLDVRENCYPSGPQIKNTFVGWPDCSNYSAPPDRYCGIIVTNTTDGRDYFYWHIHGTDIPQAVWDAYNNNTNIPVGQNLGRLIDWCAYGCFHHVHYEINTGWSTPQYNAGQEVTPWNDPYPPNIIQLFFCQNASNTNYFNPDVNGLVTVQGYVDIIAYIHEQNYNSAPYNYNLGCKKITYEIDQMAGSNDTGELLFCDFPYNSTVPDDSVTTYFYKDSPPCDSDSTYYVYDAEKTYYIVTNSNHAGTYNESPYYWDTIAIPDGLYKVTVNAWDDAGEQETYSQVVRVMNNFVPTPVDIVYDFGSGTCQTQGWWTQNWKTCNPPAPWQLTAQDPCTDGCFQHTDCHWETGASVPYNNNVGQMLVMPTIDLTFAGGTYAWVTFCHKYDLQNSFDGVWIVGTYDDPLNPSANWFLINPTYCPYNMQMAANGQCDHIGQMMWSGSNASWPCWDVCMLDLYEHHGNFLTLAWVFVSDAVASGNLGYYLDHVWLQTDVPVDVFDFAAKTK